MNRNCMLLMVVDDTSDMFIYQQLIHEHISGCEIITAANAEDGLKLAAENDIDGTLIDVQMPGMNGIEMCRHLKSDGKTKNIPAMLITAHSSTVDLRVQGFEAGADDFISCPINNDELIARVKVMLRIGYAEKKLRLMNERLENTVIERTKKLQESELMYRLLAENATDVIWTRDMDFQLTYISPSIERMRGFTVEEVLTQSLDEVMTPASVELSLKNFSYILELEKQGGHDLYGSKSLELEMCCKDGTTIWTEVVSSFIRDENNKVTGVLGITRDITSRMQAEEAKQESELKYQTILDSINEGYFEVDLSGNFTFSNEAMLNMLGYAEKEMIGLNNREYMDSENAKKVFDIFNEVYRSEVSTKASDWQLIKKDGSIRIVETSVILKKDSTGKPIGFRGIARNITVIFPRKSGHLAVG